MTIGTLVIMVLFLYFGMIRPQKVEEEKSSGRGDNLHVGDEVSTNGGIIGRIVRIKDDIVTLETGSDGNKFKVFKWGIRAVEVPAEELEESSKQSKKK